MLIKVIKNTKEVLFMDSDYIKFEKKWLLIFIGMYVLIMLPLPFFYSTTYIPSFFGIPLFLIGWIVHTFATLVLIYIYSKEALKRKEYQIFDEKEGGKINE